MTSTPRLTWTTPAMRTLSVSLDTAFGGGSAADAADSGRPNTK